MVIDKVRRPTATKTAPEDRGCFGILATYKITKVGHCCLFINGGDQTVVTDPGSFTVGAVLLEQIVVVLIMHEHADHGHVPTVIELS